MTLPTIAQIIHFLEQHVFFTIIWRAIIVPLIAGYCIKRANSFLDKKDRRRVIYEHFRSRGNRHHRHGHTMRHPLKCRTGSCALV